MTLKHPSYDDLHNFEYLLLGLLFISLVNPAIRTFAPPAISDFLVSTILGAALAAGSFSLVASATARATASTLGLVIGACHWLGGYLNLPLVSSVFAVGFMLFCFWAIAISLRQVLAGPGVDFNRIAGAICVYLLMALAWSSAYALLAVHVDTAFAGLAGVTAVDFDSVWPELIYLSLATLTTLGYGDISPVVPLARALAYLEAVVGQMYIAILIAGLVGAHLSARRSTSQDPER